MSEHSLIGASSAYRWINCPGSVPLYGLLTERRTSLAAATGTAAHEICERCLLSGDDPERYLGSTVSASGMEIEVTESMVSAVGQYVARVREDFTLYGGKLVVEQDFSLEWLYPGMFGRNDASLIPDRVFGTLRTYDYKNGKKAVFAEENTQCMYYALGALGKDNPWMVEDVESVIVQPNAWGKDEPVDRWRVPVSRLYEWVYDVLRPAAVRTREPDAPCVAGEWCGFCEAAHLCPVRQEKALSLLDAPADGAVACLPGLDTLSPERIGVLSAFFQSAEFTAWVSALAAEEQAMLARGVDIPGRKLIETTVLGNRRWLDEKEVTAAFGYLGDELFTTKIKSPAQIEKILTAQGVSKPKREAAVSPLVTRDESRKVQVVSESDGRSAISAAQEKAIDLLN